MDIDTALAAGDVVVAPPSTWLLRPDDAPPGSFRLHVLTDPPARFVAGTHPSPDGEKRAARSAFATSIGSSV